MRKTLYPYQEEAVRSIFKSYSIGNRSPILQLPTGGGKTVVAAEIILKFLELNPTKKVVFFVHRSELLDQFAMTFVNQSGGEACGIVDADTRFLNSGCRVYVSMIETAYNRLNKRSNYFGDNVGMVIADECHIASFDKIFDHFRNSVKLGLSATPMRLGKKNRLSEVYDDIISTVNIRDLVGYGSLTPNKTWSIDTGVEFSKIGKRMGDFDVNSIANTYSNTKHIDNVVKYYIELCNYEKTIVFNSNVSHSLAVNNAFLPRGFDSKHLDGKMCKSQRKEILHWFSETPNAILNNVGILTMGFDEPSIINVVMNRPTMSLPLWLQCTGRGGRLFDNKPFFRIIDLGGNVERLGDWSEDREWSLKDSKPSSPGVAPIKTCPECYFITHPTASSCPECAHIFVKKSEREHDPEVKMRLVVDLFSESVKVDSIVKKVNRKGWKDYSGLFLLRDKALTFIASVQDDKQKMLIKNEYVAKAKEWYNLQGVKPNYGHEKFILKILETKNN